MECGPKFSQGRKLFYGRNLFIYFTIQCSGQAEVANVGLGLNGKWAFESLIIIIYPKN